MAVCIDVELQMRDAALEARHDRWRRPQRGYNPRCRPDLLRIGGKPHPAGNQQLLALYGSAQSLLLKMVEQLRPTRLAPYWLVKEYFEADAGHDVVADIDCHHHAVRHIDQSVKISAYIGAQAGPADLIEDRRELTTTNAAEIDPQLRRRAAPHTANKADRNRTASHGPDLFQAFGHRARVPQGGDLNEQCRLRCIADGRPVPLEENTILLTAVRITKPGIQ